MFRFILLALGLLVAAAGLQRLTSARVPEGSLVIQEKPAVFQGVTVPFRLVLSAPAAEVELESGEAVRPPLADSPLSGNLSLDARNPHVGISVRWKQPAAAGEHRFAKLTLEVPGQETFTHVFDSDGDIDDFVELPLPVKK